MLAWPDRAHDASRSRLGYQPALLRRGAGAERRPGRHARRDRRPGSGCASRGGEAGVAATAKPTSCACASRPRRQPASTGSRRERASWTTRGPHVARRRRAGGYAACAPSTRSSSCSRRARAGTTRRTVRKLEQDYGDRLSFDVYRDQADLPRVLRDCEAVSATTYQQRARRRLRGRRRRTAAAASSEPSAGGCAHMCSRSTANRGRSGSATSYEPGRSAPARPATTPRLRAPDPEPTSCCACSRISAPIRTSTRSTGAAGTASTSSTSRPTATSRRTC